MNRDTINHAMRACLLVCFFLGIALGIASQSAAKEFYLFAAAVAAGGLVMDYMRARRERQRVTVSVTKTPDDPKGR